MAEIRISRGLTQGHMARAIGITSRMLRYYERGLTRLTAEQLGAIARALQCQTTDLLLPPGSLIPAVAAVELQSHYVDAYCRPSAANPGKIAILLAAVRAFKTWRGTSAEPEQDQLR